MSTNDRLVYQYIASHQKIVLPYWQIAKALGIDAKTVYRRVKHLVQQGLLETCHNTRHSGGKEAYSFRIVAPFPVSHVDETEPVREKSSCQAALHELLTELCGGVGRSCTYAIEWLANKVGYSADHTKRTLGRMVRAGLIEREYNFTPNEYGRTQLANTYTLLVAYRMDSPRMDRSPLGDATPKRSLLSFKSLSSFNSPSNKDHKTYVVDAPARKDLEIVFSAIREKLSIEPSKLFSLVSKYVQRKSVAYILEKIDFVSNLRQYTKSKLAALIWAITTDPQVDALPKRTTESATVAPKGRRHPKSLYKQQKVNNDQAAIRDERYSNFFDIFGVPTEPVRHEEQYANFYQLFPESRPTA